MSKHYKKSIDWFSREMKNKMALPKNVAKSHWRSLSMETLLHMLKLEVDECATAIYKSFPDSEKLNTDIILECADIGNFAMMIADNARRRFIGKRGKINE